MFAVVKTVASVAKMQSVRLLTSSSSMVIGQYLIGKYLAWLKIPSNGLKSTVLLLAPGMPGYVLATAVINPLFVSR